MLKIDRRTIETIIISFLIILFATFIRSQNLTRIPVFADEAIYIRWAQVMKAEPTLRFLPLSDGKQPLFMWAVIPFFKIFDDPLVAGRFVSVLSNIVAMSGIAFLSYELFRSRKIVLFTLSLYSLSPFIFFFNRMALVDSMLAAGGVWTVYFAVLTAKRLSLDTAMLGGFALGFSFLTKSPALFFALLTPFSSLFIKRANVLSITKFVGLNAILVGLGYAIYNILRLGPNFHMIASRNLDYVLPYSHILTNPKDPFIFHLDRALEWIWTLGPWPILVLAALASIQRVSKSPRQIALLVAFFVLPLITVSMYAKVFTARYIFFVLPPLFILAGSVNWTKTSKYLVMPLVCVFLIISTVNIFHLSLSPAQSTLPQSERSGYLSEWTAGDGIREISEFIKSELRNNPNERIVVGTEGYFGTLPDGLQMYLEKVNGVTVIGTGLDFGEVPQSLINAKKSGDKVYFVVNASRLKLKKDFSEYGLVVRAKYDKVPRETYSHEYVVYGPRETLYFFELTN